MIDQYLREDEAPEPRPRCIVISIEQYHSGLKIIAWEHGNTSLRATLGYLNAFGELSLGTSQGDGDRLKQMGFHVSNGRIVVI